MTFWRNPADGAGYRDLWKYRQESEPNNRIGKQSTIRKIGIVDSYHLIETLDCLPCLGADSANKEITESRHFAKYQRRPVLDFAVGLRQRRQDDIAFFYGLYSALGSLIRLKE